MGRAQTGIQQNHDMRRISAVAALIAVPVAIAGVCGMNLDHMPELHRLFGYPLMPGATDVLVTLVTLVYLVFHKKRRL